MEKEKVKQGFTYQIFYQFFSFTLTEKQWEVRGIFKNNQSENLFPTKNNSGFSLKKKIVSGRFLTLKILDVPLSAASSPSPASLGIMPK